MKATAQVITNMEKIEEAKKQALKLGIEVEIPKPAIEEVDFYFDLNFVGYAYNYPKKIISARIYGMDIKLLFKEDLWKILTEHLSRKH